MKYCSQCGAQLNASAKTCSSCGATQMIGASTRNRTIAILLAFFLGSLGVHKFYTGRPIWAVLYFIFSWTTIPGIVGVIESIIWLLTSDAEFDAKYNQSKSSNNQGN